jgi:hypothetical protein
MDRKLRASQADRLLNDDVLQEALSVIKKSQIGVFTSPNSSQEDIMEASRMVRALGAIEDQLMSFVNDGKLLERQEKGQHRG